jgi:diguanylate cyclase (GGDEF)-like protein/PAS domain S-box-containing protein
LGAAGAGLFGLCVVAPAFLTWSTHRWMVETDHRDRTAQLGANLTSRLEQFHIALDMARGLFQASKSVERDEWRAFVSGHEAFERLPGRRVFGFAERVATDGLEEFLARARADGQPDFEIQAWPEEAESSPGGWAVVRFAEPEEAGRDLVGRELSCSAQLESALLRSARNNQMAATGIVEVSASGGSSGVFLGLPVYEKGADLSDSSGREHAASGWVFCLLDINGLMETAALAFGGGFDLELVDPAAEAGGATLYRRAGAGGSASAGALTGRVEITVGDRVWLLSASDPSPDMSEARPSAARVGAVGLAVVVLLELVLWSVLRTGQRARALAGKLTGSLRESEERYALAIAGSDSGIWDWDLTRGRVYYSERWKQLLGCAPAEIDDTPDAWFARILSCHLPRFHSEFNAHLRGETAVLDTEIEMLHSDGGTRWMLCRAAAVRDAEGRATRLAGSMSDITALKRAEEELRYLASYDPLTGLRNRREFLSHVQSALARARKTPEYKFALLFIDFDRFKLVNDTLGHRVGDGLLRGIAERFRGLLGESDVIARFGGDEFVILVDNVRGWPEVRSACERIVAEMARPHQIEGHEVVSTASVGVACSDGACESAETMLRYADAAVYTAKAAGRSCYRVFDAAMFDAMMARHDLEHDLRSARLEEQIRIVYQPVISLEDGGVVGFEALARWEHPSRGLMEPACFLEIAEESGAITALGEIVLRRACRQVRSWRSVAGGSECLSIAVNISRRQLLQSGFVGMVRSVIRESEIDAASLILEISESVMMDGLDEISRVLAELRDIGVSLAMDDFGTGHSSLSCLHTFPLSALKIDRSFIVHMSERREFSAVLHAIVSLADNLGLRVIAEGVEAREQLVQLQAMGCAYAQGYLFSRELTAPEVLAYLAAGLRRAA